MTDDAVALRGSCHCGKLVVAFLTTQAAGALHPRACDCAFCTKHGAAWLSDPAGTLVIETARPPREYRQGSGSARFLLCGDCGVLVAVLNEGDEGLRGAANVRCMEDAAAFAEAACVSPRQLSRDDRIARWRMLWTPAAIKGPVAGAA